MMKSASISLERRPSLTRTQRRLPPRLGTLEWRQADHRLACARKDTAISHIVAVTLRARARALIDPCVATTPCLSSAHAVCGEKVAASIRNELTVRRMVDRLHPDDPFDEGVIVLVDVRQKVELRGGGTHDEDRQRVFKSPRDLVEIALLVGRMTMFGRLAGMFPDVMMRAFDRRCLEALAVEVKDLGLVLVEP